jgi:hypothetical protein
MSSCPNQNKLFPAGDAVLPCPKCGHPVRARSPRMMLRGMLDHYQHVHIPEPRREPGSIAYGAGVASRIFRS